MSSEKNIFQQRRIQKEIEMFSNIYEKISLKIEENRPTILEMEDLIQEKDGIPKHIAFIFPNEYPFKSPKIKIYTKKNEKTDYNKRMMATNLPRVLYYLKEYKLQINDFICSNALEQRWSPAYKLEHMIYYIQYLNHIKVQIKYAILLGEKFPDDVGRYIISFMYSM
jgi:ubiquitin-protein ligase